MAICKRCGRPIEYRTTLKGRSMPVDPYPVAIITKKGTVVHGWISHFCTCKSSVHYLPAEVTITQRQFVLG